MRLLPLLVALVAAPLLAAVNGLTPENHLAGPEVEARAAEGKVVALYGFGWRCPRCKACLPKVAKLARELAQEKRALLLGSHLQSPNAEAVKAMLAQAGCPELPTYQSLSLEDAPDAGNLLPLAYVADHTGKVVWAGSPLEDFAGFEQALRDAIKSAPKPLPGSLADGLDLRHNRDLAGRLMIGQNIEGALRQLHSRVRRGGQAGEEAARLLSHCQAWAETAKQTVLDNLEAHPSIALAEGQTLLRTLPTQAAELRAQLEPLAQNPQTRALAASRLALSKLRREAARAPGRVKTSAALQLRRLGALPEQSDPDLLALRADWEAFIDALPDR